MPDLQGLILAGGLGSRLAADDVGAAKPLVPVGGVPQVVRLVGALRDAGCGEVVCMVRADQAPEVAAALARAGAGGGVVPCRTPSSLHTLVAGLAAARADLVLCTMVDTFMAHTDWATMGERAARDLAAGEEDLLLAVTPFTGDDERPLFVDVVGAGRVRRIGEVPGERPLVTGGIYALAPAAQRLAGACAEAGLSRLRAFLAHAAAHLSIGAVEIERMIDIDRRSDLEAAESWLAETADLVGTPGLTEPPAKE